MCLSRYNLKVDYFTGRGIFLMSLILIIKAVLLGIIEGITEFLPISSTGHMIIADQFIKLSKDKSFTSAFEVVIQLGAILSVIILFWDKLWPFSGTKKEKVAKWNLWFKVAVGVIPAVILVALKIDDAIEKKLFFPVPVAIALVFYGIVLIIVEDRNKGKRSYKINDFKGITFKLALYIGLFQCLATIPGTSRSAATIIGGMLFGLSRATAAEFSFFLSIPTMIGASMLTIIKKGIDFSATEWITMGIGFFVSFIVAMAVIKVFMGYIKKKDFKVFAYYRIVLGIIVLALAFFGVM